MFRDIKGWMHPSSGKQLAIKQNEQINLKKRSKQNVQKWIILQLKLKTQWARSTADQKQMRREYRHTAFYCAFCFTELRRCCTFTNGGQDPSPGKGWWLTWLPWSGIKPLESLKDACQQAEGQLRRSHSESSRATKSWTIWTRGDQAWSGV